ncbi:MAG: DUF3488 domain-containing protein, partial [Elusimicrobia bacterium]|nr:DUF3488 domain-containing protein [Elusimicrobiota bacterium]
PLGAAELGDVAPGGSARAELRLVLPQRGRIVAGGLLLESLYPFGFFRARLRVPPAELLVLPQAAPFSPQAALEEDPRARTDGSARRARSGEFFGPRPYAPDDDARLIHWKLTAKTGSPVVAEYAQAPQGRALVRLEGADEPAVERAAAACRWHVDSGAETGLVGLGVEVPPARGLDQLDRLLRALALVGAGGAPRPAPEAAPARDDGPADSTALRRLTLAGGILVYASLFLVDDLSPRVLLAFAPLIPLGWLLHERGGPFPSKRLWNLLSVLALLYLTLVDWRRSGVAVANAHLLGYLLLNRLLSPWPRRELRQVFLILYLAFFLVSALTISPWYLPLFLAWLAFAGSWLLLQSGARPERPSSWAGPLARLLAGGALLGALIFVAVPRVEGLRRFNPFAASGMDKLAVRSEAVTGFTNRVTLGYFGDLRKSSARVMRVRPENPPKSAASAPAIYVRGAAFDRFDGRSWTKAPMPFRWRSGRRIETAADDRAWIGGRGGTLAFPATTGGDGGRVDIEMYPMRLSVVFTVGAPRLIDGLPGRAWFDHTDTVYAQDPFGGGARYRVYAAPPGREPTDAAVDLRARARAAALQLPPDPGGRLAALAARWTKGLADPRRRADAIVARLQSGYAYSSHSGGSTLSDFLFVSRSGNCEYFATAAAILMREAGVPARLVTGFHADEWNEWGRFYDVRQSQAHAWVEALLPGRGWVRYDATPAESGWSAAADAFSRRLQRLFDAAQSRWYRSVIGYDQYAQKNELMRLRFARLLALAQGGLSVLLQRALPAVLLLGLLVWGLPFARALLRRGDEYERAERALARAGLPRKAWQTPREFARDVAAARPDLAGLADLVEAHYRRRYAGRADGEAARRRAKETLARLRKRL